MYSLSRLARSTKDAIAISDRLAKSGADLVSLSDRIDTTTATGTMAFRLLSAIAEFEADLVAERTKRALGHLRSQGKRISGRIPYGYDLATDGQCFFQTMLNKRVFDLFWRSEQLAMAGARSRQL